MLFKLSLSLNILLSIAVAVLYGYYGSSGSTTTTTSIQSDTSTDVQAERKDRTVIVTKTKPTGESVTIERRNVVETTEVKSENKTTASTTTTSQVGVSGRYRLGGGVMYSPHDMTRSYYLSASRRIFTLPAFGDLIVIPDGSNTRIGLGISVELK